MLHERHRHLPLSFCNWFSSHIVTFLLYASIPPFHPFIFPLYPHNGIEIRWGFSLNLLHHYSPDSTSDHFLRVLTISYFPSISPSFHLSSHINAPPVLLHIRWMATAAAQHPHPLPVNELAFNECFMVVTSSSSTLWFYIFLFGLFHSVMLPWHCIGSNIFSV